MKIHEIHHDKQQKPEMDAPWCTSTICFGPVTSMVNDPDHMDRLFKSGDQRCQIWAVVEQPLPDGATRSKDPPMSIEHQHIPYANIWGILMVNVTMYSIHGSYGI